MYKWLLKLLLDQRGWSTEMAVTGVSDIDDAIPQYWAEGILTDATRESFWGQLSGKEGSGMAVIDKTGPLKQKGDLLAFNTIAQLMGTGVTGENVLKGNEEILSIGSFTVTCDIVRHAVAVSRKSTRQANFDEISLAGKLLKEWMTRKTDNDSFTTILNGCSDTLYANSAAGVGYLAANQGHEFGMNELEMIRLALLRQGADPIQVVKSNQRTVPVYGVVLGEIEEYRLYQNTAFLQTIRETWERFSAGTQHPLINNAIGMYRNLLIYRYYSVLPIPQGTPLRPETVVAMTLATAGTNLTVGGTTPSSGAIPNYTLFFASSGSLAVTTSGNTEIVGYTSKQNNAFLGLTRGELNCLGGSATTARQHSPSTNSLVTQRDVSSVIGFGAETLFRAIGDSPEPIGEKDDFGEQIGLGIRAYYGQALKKDKRRNKTKNCVVLKCYSANPGSI